MAQTFAQLVKGISATNAPANSLTIDSSGRVGIGTTSPGNPLAISQTVSTTFGNAGTYLGLGGTENTAGQTVLIGLGYKGAATNEYPAVIGYTATSNAGNQNGAIVFGTRSVTTNTAPTERARIDSDGRLLVGTSTSASAGGSSQYGKVQIVGNAFSAGSFGILTLSRDETAANITSGETIATIAFGDSTGNEFGYIQCIADANAGSSDYPGRLVFSTTADGASSPTGWMTLKNNGNLLLGTAGQVWDERFSSSTGSSTIVGGFYSSNASYTSAVIRAQAEAAAGTGWILFEGKRSGGVSVVYVYGNGNLQNTNNSYGQISDEKLKENIVDANSQWSDLKGVRVRNFNFKDGETHRQIGVIAQELEQISPGLVYETVDRDEDGNELGTTTKAVQYSVLYMKAVKALQEAMERIEQLEASNAAMEARLAALEAS